MNFLELFFIQPIWLKFAVISQAWLDYFANQILFARNHIFKILKWSSPSKHPSIITCEDTYQWAFSHRYRAD